MRPITKRQQQVLDFMRAYYRKHGYPATRREISLSLGSSHPNASTPHLQALLRRGLVRHDPLLSRGWIPCASNGIPLVSVASLGVRSDSLA